MSIIPVVAGLSAGIATYAVTSSLEGRHFVEYSLSGFRTGTIRKGALSFAVGILTAAALSPDAPHGNPTPTAYKAAPKAG